jgi:hypothetical protein
MKITVESKELVTVDIPTPAYYKSTWGTGVYYLNDDAIIHVMNLAIVSYTSAESTFNNEAVRISKFEPTTEEHFKTEFDKAMTSIQALIPFS